MLFNSASKDMGILLFGQSYGAKILAIPKPEEGDDMDCIEVAEPVERVGEGRTLRY